MKKNLINKSDNFFIAGSTGMVGSAICRRLKKSGYGNLLTPSRNELDLSDYESLRNWFCTKNPDVVIVAAAKVGGIKANAEKPVDFLLENLKIQNNLIELSYQNRVKRLLFLGSSCIYPKFSQQPIEEESLLSGELEPTNEWYALAKISGLKLCEAMRVQNNFDAISLMPTNLYGPGDNYNLFQSHVLPAMIMRFKEALDNADPFVKCWGTGKPLREFLHVDDLSDAVLFALEHWDPRSKDAPKDKKGNPLLFLNVGTGVDISIKELSEIIAKEIGYNGKIMWDESRPDGTPKKQLDTKHLKKMGWQAKINLREGIKSTILDFKKEVLNGSIRK